MKNAHIHFRPGQTVYYMNNYQTWDQREVTFDGMDSRFEHYCKITMADGSKWAVHECHLSNRPVSRSENIWYGEEVSRD